MCSGGHRRYPQKLRGSKTGMVERASRFPSFSQLMILQAMLDTHVNLCDLLDDARNGCKTHIFSTEDQLREYTINSGRIFPKEDAYAGGLLRYLLRDILGGYNGTRGKKGCKKERKYRS